jgi:hypothetical protein
MSCHSDSIGYCSISLAGNDNHRGLDSTSPPALALDVPLHGVPQGRVQLEISLQEIKAGVEEKVEAIRENGGEEEVCDVGLNVKRDGHVGVEDVLIVEEKTAGGNFLTRDDDDEGVAIEEENLGIEFSFFTHDIVEAEDESANQIISSDVITSAAATATTNDPSTTAATDNNDNTFEDTPKNTATTVNTFDAITTITTNSSDVATSDDVASNTSADVAAKSSRSSSEDDKMMMGKMIRSLQDEVHHWRDKYLDMQLARDTLLTTSPPSVSASADRVSGILIQ